MSAPVAAAETRRLSRYLAIAVLVFALDQITKILVQQHAPRYLPILGETFGIRLTGNTGAAFGLFASGGPVLIATTVAAIAVILYFSRHAQHLHPLILPAFALQLGGALGNLLDRIRFGHVVDFIYLSFWPTFNVADIAITVGVVLLAFALLVTPQDAPEKDRKSP